MPKWIAVGLGLFCVLLALFAVLQTNRLDGLEGEVEKLSRTVQKLERQKAVVRAEDAPTQADLEALRGEVAQVKTSIDGGAEPLVAATPRAPGEPLHPLINEADITQLVDARVEAKLKEEARQRGGGGERKMPVQDLAKELDLDPATQERVSGVADNTKTELFQMLSTPRADGTSFIDDLRAAVQSGDQSKMMPVYMKLFSENIPGTDVTYLKGIGEIRGRGHESLRGVMGDVTYKQYADMKIHPDHILTSYNPFAEFEPDNNK